MDYSTIGSTASRIQQTIFNNPTSSPPTQHSRPITRHPSTTLNNQAQQPAPSTQQTETQSETDHIQAQADQLDLLQILDPAGKPYIRQKLRPKLQKPKLPKPKLTYLSQTVNAASTLTHIRNCLLIPPMINHYGTPNIQLEQHQHHNHHNQLDTHLLSIINHPSEKPPRRQQINRLIKGFKAFVCTPIGILFTIYGFLVVFWGAALVLILLGWLKITPQKNYRIWVEICSQVLNGLFTIPGIGLFPSRIIDCWNIAIISFYARVIWKRQGRKNLEDPNHLIPPYKPSPSPLPPPLPPPPIDTDRSSADSVIDGMPPAHHEEAEEKEIHQVEEEQERVELEPQHDDDDDDNQDDEDRRPGQVIVVHPEEETEEYREEDVDVDDEGRVGLTDVWKEAQEMVLNEAELDRLRAAQEALCRSQTWYRPHSSATHYWTTATFMALSFSCGITSGILIWRIGLKTSKKTKVIREVKKMIRGPPSTKKKKEEKEKNTDQAPEEGEGQGGEVVVVGVGVGVNRIIPRAHLPLQGCTVTTSSHDQPLLEGI
ncbi:hypothetical protein PGTUg99_018363 [Puccinia graminis f. sp. tritici]|uniref:Uncharacterized protein n=1 Tax=Puccinia graminis f. sp. tritici TaxID=56615 RepID=A0A5B0R6H3_PUCGR|nr:hypothetical protein PGTUg99_018363 [Puccinia graminis f. sp. tritici]